MGTMNSGSKTIAGGFIIVFGLGFLLWQNVAQGIGEDNTLAKTSVLSRQDGDITLRLSNQQLAVGEFSGDLVEILDQDSRVVFSAPLEVAEDIRVEEFSPAQPLNIGFGAETYVQYNADQNRWQAFDGDSSIGDGVLREDSLIIVHGEPDSVAEATATASYTSGNGDCGQTALLFSTADSSYRLSLPDICQSGFRIADYEEIIADIARSVSFR